MSEKEIVGIVEEVEIEGRNKVKAIALFDTGARMTSVDVRLAAKAGLGPIIKTTKVSQSSLKTQVRRPVVKVIVHINGKPYEAHANIQDREHMSFPVLIGRNIISGNFMIDANKNIEIVNKAMRNKLNDRRR